MVKDRTITIAHDCDNTKTAHSSFRVWIKIKQWIVKTRKTLRIENWPKLNKTSIFGVILFLFLAVILFPADHLTYTNLTNPLSWLALSIYLSIHLFSVFGLVVAISNTHFWIRIIAEIYLFSALMVEVLFLNISGHRFSTFDAINLSTNSHYGNLAFQNFREQFLISFVITSALYLILFFIKKNASQYQPKALVVTLVSLFATTTFSLFVKGSNDLFAVAYRAPYSLVLAGLEEKEFEVEREEVKAVPVKEGVKHVVLIVDESVGGDHLTINDSKKTTTPFLRTIEEKMINFGIASSFTNNSAGSNIALISGASIKEIPDPDKNILTKPNIFQYAKKAGYKTYFIDAQTEDSQLQNFVTLEDLKYVDVHLTAPSDQPYFLRDFAFADSLINISKLEEKVFVYFNKYGAHWPYKESFPSRNVPLTLLGGLQQKHADEMDYAYALRWTVDEFWKKLITNTNDKDNFLIVYTSDHGQNFGGSPMRHGTIYAPNSSEASVPLWIYDPTSTIEKPKTERNGIYSHANIFPTLLHFMGYQKKQINENYGPTLLDYPSNNQPFFISGDIFERGTVYRNNFIKMAP